MASSAGYIPTISNVASTNSSGDGNDGAPIETFVDEGLALPTPSSRNSTFMSVRDRMLKRHDSMFSVSSQYEDPSDNDLNVWQGAALLTADCMGTGLLALPEDVRVLGRWIGLGFLILNLPINLYAGTILSHSAAHVEGVQAEENNIYQQRQQEVLQQIAEESGEDDDDFLSTSSKDELMVESPTKNRGNRKKGYSSVDQHDTEPGDSNHQNDVILHEDNSDIQNSENNNDADGNGIVVDRIPSKEVNPHQTVHHDTATFDFIGMTQALFSSRKASRWVMILFYTNIFLVLGDYILVMSHAVSALVGEQYLCIPEAGILASTLMFAVTQIRTMARLGRAASVISLSALFIVVIQCLWAVHMNTEEDYAEASSEDFVESPSLLRKFSALGSIGFAVGSQKLFLNIRHEMREREKAPKTLGISLSAFGIVYVAIILLAGSDPPSFLFDAIPPGWNRRLAGFLLWIHVVVSYSINSQAICASMDRLFLSNVETFGLNKKPMTRWMCLTGMLAVSAFLVANAVPFFADLVSLIGSLTSVPLTLLLPAVFYRQYMQIPIWRPTKTSMASYALLVFACVFMIAAVIGSINSIELDWAKHGGPFACH